MRTIEPKVIYIAGPMTGLPELNRLAFMEAEKALTEAGFVVLNPAWLPAGLPPAKYMPICLAMLDAAGAVYMLEGWERSHGALIERSYALYQGKAVFEPEKEGEKE